jgi:hypothetical protein
MCEQSEIWIEEMGALVFLPYISEITDLSPHLDGALPCNIHGQLWNVVL